MQDANGEDAVWGLVNKIWNKTPKPIVGGKGDGGARQQEAAGR